MGKVNAQDLREQFQRSGLSQREFGKQLGLSSSMVSYYIRKAREENAVNQDQASFSKLIVDHKTGKQIYITTAEGVKIEIPI